MIRYNGQSFGVDNSVKVWSTNNYNFTISDTIILSSNETITEKKPNINITFFKENSSVQVSSRNKKIKTNRFVWGTWRAFGLCQKLLPTIQFK